MMQQFATIFFTVFLFSNLSSGNALDPPESIEIKIVNDQQIFSLNLKRTDQYLANQNLPIWLARKNEEPELVSDVMREIGPFTMYHDTKMSAAVVLFQNGRYLSGVIDTRFYIKELPFSNEKQDIIAIVGSSHIKRRSDRYSHDKLSKSPVIDDMKSGYINTTSLSGGTAGVRITRKLYIEVLCFITNNIYYYWTKKGRDLKYLVGYYLVHFNAIDMLFAKLPDDLKIHINIAGFVIETEQDVFPVAHIPGKIPLKYIDSDDTLNIFSKYISKYNQVFVCDLFDVFFISTQYDLKSYEDIVDGLSVPVNNYEHRLSGDTEYEAFGSIVTRQKYWNDFVTSAHEIAHLMHVKHDPVTEGLICNDVQCYAILQIFGYFCRNCIKWSEQSIYELRTFASSNVERCFLLNPPRSLKPFGLPILTLTPSQQCSCYGYRHHWSEFLKNVYLGLHCNKKLACSYYIQTASNAIPKPIDGTPCGIRKVCLVDNHKLRTNNCIELENYQCDIPIELALLNLQIHEKFAGKRSVNR